MRFLALKYPILLAATLFSLTACTPGATDPDPVLVLGHTTPDRAWVRIVGDAAGPWALQDATGTIRTFQADPDGLLALDGLKPGQPYTLYHRKVQSGNPGLTFTPPLADQTPTLFFGSCLNADWQGLDETILNTLRTRAQSTPGARMLWLGDTLYLDDDDLKTPQSLEAAWGKRFRIPAMRSLLSAVPQYAIWDDHDFGPNDADSNLPQAATSYRVFTRHWANPPVAIPGTSLINYRFRQGPVEVFMLDDRTERSPLNGFRRGKTQFGPRQMAWLKAGLLDSTAPFKLVVSGGQFFTDDAAEEGWHHYPDERLSFESWLEQHPLKGLLFVSGDRHHTTFFRRRIGPDLVVRELTCSALTSHPEPAEPSGYAMVQRQFTVVENNFCQLDFDVGKHAIGIRILGRNGQELASGQALP